ncbi:MAG: hypothetical protein PUF78_08585 [Lachnospiraceae bacterium]|nr:hypothetical protein [Lachnospiraceae bacterium]
MANLLQVSSPDLTSVTPGLNTNTQNINQAGNAGRVNTNGQIRTGNENALLNEENLTGQVVDFTSNYSAFLQNMQEASMIPEEVMDLLFRDGKALAESKDPEMAKAFSELFSEIQMNDPKELESFLKEQVGNQVKYSGEFFDSLRSLLRETTSDNYRSAILQFARTYNSYTSGSHLLQQMENLTEDIRNLLLQSQQDDFQNLMDQMDWTAHPGKTETNAAVLNDKLIPFLSSYISKTHDYGPIRKAAVLLTLYAVKYEEGSEDHLIQAYQKLSRNGDFHMYFQSDPEEALVRSMQSSLKERTNAGLTEHLSEILLKGTEGKAGTEAVNRYYTVLNSLLNNESVYLPLLHMLIPFRYQNKEVASEIWIDPNAGQNDSKKGSGEAGGGSVRFFLKFRIRELGDFDMIGNMAKTTKKLDLQIFLPAGLPEKPRKIQAALTEILRRKGLTADISLSPRSRAISVREVFPGIREKERTINVRV